MLVLVTISTAAVALGLLDMPFGFYMLLRATLCLTAVVGFAAARRRGDQPWTWTYGALAVLYNPVLPVHLGAKGLWILVNAGTLILLWVGAMRLRLRARYAEVERQGGDTRELAKPLERGDE